MSRLEAIHLKIHPNLAEKYRDPYLLREEITRHKKVNIKHIKTASFFKNSSTICLVTDDPETHKELSSPWAPDAFTKGAELIPRNASPAKNDPKTATLSGLPTSLDLESNDVKEELTAQGITEAKRVIKKKTNEKTTIVHLTFANKESMEAAIKNRIRLALTTYRVERVIKILQCFRCQRLGHTTRSCQFPEKCVRCSGPHNHSTCSPDTQPKCANCHGPHSACSRQCPVLKAPIQQQKQGTPWNTAPHTSQHPNPPSVTQNTNKPIPLMETTPSLNIHSLRQISHKELSAIIKHEVRSQLQIQTGKILDTLAEMITTAHKLKDETTQGLLTHLRLISEKHLNLTIDQDEVIRSVTQNLKKQESKPFTYSQTRSPTNPNKSALLNHSFESPTKPPSPAVQTTTEILLSEDDTPPDEEENGQITKSAPNLPTSLLNLLKSCSPHAAHLAYDDKLLQNSKNPKALPKNQTKAHPSNLPDHRLTAEQLALRSSLRTRPNKATEATQ